MKFDRQFEREKKHVYCTNVGGIQSDGWSGREKMNKKRGRQKRPDLMINVY